MSRFNNLFDLEASPSSKQSTSSSDLSFNLMNSNKESDDDIPFIPNDLNFNSSLSPLIGNNKCICGNCELSTATSFCLQCEEDCALLCPECADKHNDMKAFRKHEVVLLGHPTLNAQQFLQQEIQSKSPLISGSYDENSSILGYSTSTSPPLFSNNNVLGMNFSLPTQFSRKRNSTISRYVSVAKKNIDFLTNLAGSQLNEHLRNTSTYINFNIDNKLTTFADEIEVVSIQIVGYSLEDVNVAIELIQIRDTYLTNISKNSSYPDLNSLSKFEINDSKAISSSTAAAATTTTTTTNNNNNNNGLFNFDTYPPEKTFKTSTLLQSSQPFIPASTQFAKNTADQSIAFNSTSRDQEVILYMDCPHDKVKLVIGAKGIIIKNIMRRSRTTIIIDEKFPDGHPRKVEIRGNYENNRIAQSLIQSVISHGPTILDDYNEKNNTSGMNNNDFINSGIRGSKSLGGHNNTNNSLVSSSHLPGKGRSMSENPNDLSISIRCPADKISIVIGAKGVIINEISRRSNTQISIDEDPRNSIAASAQALLGDYNVEMDDSQDDLSSNFDLRRIEIKGTREEIEMAKILIEAVVLSGPNILYASDINSLIGDIGNIKPLIPKKFIEVACPKDKVGALIGSKGVIIKEIMKKSNCQISIAEDIVEYTYGPFDLSNGESTTLTFDSRMVTIRGYPEDIEVCQQIIEEIIGSEILAIEAKSHQNNDNDDTYPSSNLSSSPPKSSSPLSHYQGNNILSVNNYHKYGIPQTFPTFLNQSQEALETVTVPLERMRDVIGIKGIVIRKLSNSSGAKIYVNNDLPEGVPRILELRGTIEQVQLAKTMLNDILISNQSNNLLKHGMNSKKSLYEEDRINNVVNTNITESNNNVTLIQANNNNANTSTQSLISNNYSYNESPIQKENHNQTKSLIEQNKNGNITQQVEFASPNAISIFNSRKLLFDKISDFTESRLKYTTYPCDNIDSDNGHIYLRITVSGNQESIHDAIILLHKLFPDIVYYSSNSNSIHYSPNTNLKVEERESQSNLYNNYLSKEDIEFDVMDCPSNKTWLLIGHRGANIKDIMKRSGATINVMKTKYLDNNIKYNVQNNKNQDVNSSHRRVVILGSKENVLTAKSSLLSLISDNKDDFENNFVSKKYKQKCLLRSSESEISDELDIDDDLLNEDNDNHIEDNDNKKHKNIMINNGDINNNNNTDSTSNNYLINSSRDIEDDDYSIVHCSIECPDDKVGVVIGFKGIVIQSMMKQSKARIVVIDTLINGIPTRVVEIKGTESQVQIAKKMVEYVISGSTMDQSGQGNQQSSVSLGIISKNIELHMDSLKLLILHFDSGFKLLMTRSMTSIVVVLPKKQEDQNLCKLVIKGSVVNVNHAITILEETMEELNIVTYQSNLDTSFQVSNKEIPVEVENLNTHVNDDKISINKGDKIKKKNISCSSPPRLTIPIHNNNQLLNNFTQSSSLSEENSTISLSSSPQNNLMGDLIEKNQNNKNNNGKSIKTSSTRTISCPIARVGTLIGTRGIIVKEVMKRSGATIVVCETSTPNPSDPTQEIREVYIRGSKNSVLLAEKLIYSLIEHGTKALSKGFVLPFQSDESNNNTDI